MRKNSTPISHITDLSKQWDHDNNDAVGLNPDKLSVGSQKIAFWICPKHGSYQQIIRNRAKGQLGCESCKKDAQQLKNRAQYLKGKSPLSETHPLLLEEWVSCSDPRVNPDTCTSGSNKKVIWQCKKCNGKYPATISNRTKQQSGCPYCSGQKALAGYNDLATINPRLASGWSKKNDIKPSEVTPKSNKKVYWTCSIGHEDFLLSVKRRSNGQGCPECAKYKQTSFPEQAIFYYIKQAFPDAINRYKEAKHEIDIYIPSTKTGIEYNGYYYHRNKVDKDLAKKRALSDRGIRLIIVQEYKNTELDTPLYDYSINTNVSLDDVSNLIRNILSDLNCAQEIAVDCKADQIAIEEQYINSIVENSIASYSSQLAKEWDFEKNGTIRPEFVRRGANKKYYWVCPKCGESYLSSPKNRVKGYGCTYCAGKTVSVGVNDLASLFPEIASEWDYEKNDKNPTDFHYGSGTYVWWKCKNNHSWENRINARTSSSEGQCPYCSNRKVWPGFNDLLSQNPTLVKEWDFKKNKIKPDEIYVKDQTRDVYWLCERCGSSWVSKTLNRTNCPNCSKERKRINVYNLSDLSFYGTFDDMHALCAHLGLDYKKQHGNISTVCSRKQRSLLGKYVLRHAYDDEFKNDND